MKYYNLDTLNNFIKENNIKLLENYENVNRETKIKAKCLTEGCEHNCYKTFRQIIDVSGCYCNLCTSFNKKKKVQQTCLKKYGTNSINQYQESNYKLDNLLKYVEDNNITLLKEYNKVKSYTIIEAKCITKDCNGICKRRFYAIVNNVGCYCKSCTAKNRFKKLKATNLEKYGVENISQSEIIKNKKVETSIKNYGVEYPLQNKDVLIKIKETNFEKYGCENPFQNEIIKQKIKLTNLDKYSVEHAIHSKIVKEKIKQTNLDKYGTHTPLQNEIVKNKIKMTILEKYGVENISQSDIIKNKKVETSIKKYGVEYPMQNSNFAENASKNAYLIKEYKFPSGRIEKIQGYENYTLDTLLNVEHINEDDIVLSKKEVPECFYFDKNGKKRRYYVDCFIKSQNRCIETKSTWTAKKNIDVIFIKQQALKDLGYNCEIWIYNSKGEIVECYK